MVVVALTFAGACSAQLFDNLKAFGSRLKVGDPTVPATQSLDGPKGIATADFDGDSWSDLAVANTDGTVTVFYGKGEGAFSAPVHLAGSGGAELRGIVAADFTGDGKPDLAVASPYAAEVLLYVNRGGVFGEPTHLASWRGARNLAAGDFDGDGRLDVIIAGTTNGLRQCRGLGGGEFETMTNLTSLAVALPEFPKPVFALASFRPSGSTRDELVVTHANAAWVWLLAADAEGRLEIRSTMTNQLLHALAVGAVRAPAAGGSMDLVTASRDAGWVEVHAGVAGPQRFALEAVQRLYIPGGPRAVQVVDLDQDGWNDLVVALRNFDRILTYHNSNGVLWATSELTVGRSPRELVAGRFNADSYPDIAVMNRDSTDLSVIPTFPGKANFTALDQTYPVDGGVNGLKVFDFNGDGRADVLQFHRTSGELSVRLAETNGLLGEPSFLPMGSLPSAGQVVDVNGDGLADVVTANLGQPGVESGSVSVRRGDGKGGFGPEERYALPADEVGSLFALVAADFDGDGDMDLAAGFFDCRLGFFENVGGRFEFRRNHEFVYESRVMVVGDFDQDGDMDLAGAGYAGDVVVIENPGNLLTAETLRRQDYRAPSPEKFGTKDIVATDMNDDGDLDLVVGSGQGVMVFLGLEGMQFVRASEGIAGTRFPASSVIVADFDGNGARDLAVACRVLSCITLLSPGRDNEYQPVLTVDVPAGDFIASGDLDGDGFADLVGTGSVLWTALSSRRAQPHVAELSAPSRTETGHPVINEFLAINTEIPVAADGGRKSDWVELFQGGDQPVTLTGWTLRWSPRPEATSGAATDLVGTNDFLFPEGSSLPAHGRRLIVFSNNRRSPYHTGFPLPGEGGVLTLVDAQGAVVDRAEYLAQRPNVSSARFRDGHRSFVLNPYPSPDRENSDNGPLDPSVSLQDLTAAELRAEKPLRFRARGRDDLGIISLSVLWQRLDGTDPDTHRIVLFDDGLHEDGRRSDGEFSGVLTPGLPAGAEIQFYVEAVDLSEQTVVDPDEPVFARKGEPVSLYSLAIDAPRPALEISELVANNQTGLQDERGGTPDWIEIRNCSGSPVPLRGVSLSHRFLGGSGRYAFADAEVLGPAESRVVFCDNQPEQGPLHAAFTLDSEGDRVVLAGTSVAGARFPIDEGTMGSSLKV